METTMQALRGSIEHIKNSKITPDDEKHILAGVLGIIDLGKYFQKEKQQIIDFAIWFNNNDNTYKSYDQIVEQYYNETFQKEKCTMCGNTTVDCEICEDCKRY